VPELTQEYLKECLTYDPDTGIFVWKERPLNHFATSDSHGSWNSRLAGTRTIHITPAGYPSVRIARIPYLLHRLAFLYMEGEMPANDTDHINGVRDDNRWVNLRPATKSENLRNTKMRFDNKSGVMGVFLHKRSGRWGASIRDGKRKNLGFYEDWFEAVCARKSAEVRLGYHVNHGRVV
jgi:hypothetical protein